MIKQKICICGGGNLAHVVGGYLSAKPYCEVRLLTRHPERWQRDGTLDLTDINGRKFNSRFYGIIHDGKRYCIGSKGIVEVGDSAVENYKINWIDYTSNRLWLVMEDSGRYPSTTSTLSPKSMDSTPR